MAIQPGDVVVHFNGVPDSTAPGPAGRTLIVHRSIAVIEAARRVMGAASNIELIAGQGVCGLPPDLAADVVAVRIPREKMALLQLLRDAFDVLRVGGRCYVAGATNEGIKSAARLLSELFGNTEVVTRGSGHRVLAAVKRSSEPAGVVGFDSPFLSCDVFNEFEAVLRGRVHQLYTRPGVFSWDHLDEATSILADVMKIHAGQSVLDLGCGAGALGLVAATLNESAPVCMVDADVEAVRSARRTADAAGFADIEVIASDIASAVLERRFDVVVTNPPFHAGRSTDMGLPLRFIDQAWEVLEPNGVLFLVANRTLPYETPIVHRFGNVIAAHDGPRFKVLSAIKS